MSHYKTNVRDLEFNLFEVLGLETVLDGGVFGELDADTIREMIDQVRRLAEGPLAESFADADRNPPIFHPDTHSVTLREAFKKSYQALREIGWESVGLPAELGGTPLPRTVYWALSEMILGAQPAAYIYAVGPNSTALFHHGEVAQRVRTAVEQGWGGTMVLTEPEAGSDVGASRTKAIKQDDGSWHIEGVKRFISCADSDDLFKNIVHMVLARPEGAGPGTKGLSLFFVPKFHFDPQTGELGERNGVFVTNVEHKMGLKASATCEVTFSGHSVPAKGWLVGEANTGIAQMFRLIQNARMMVGTKAIATLSTGYLHARDYARTRVQGSDLTNMTNKTAPRITIINHPDVRRSLMMQKAYVEGLRAVYLYTAAHQDPATAFYVSGADPEIAGRVSDLLLPIVKGVGSERAYQYLTESLQCLGGSGYLQDYPIEQYIRDAKIDSLYEGTTAIQAQDFFFRKIARDRGVALAHVIGHIEKFTAGNTAQLKAERELLHTALVDAQAMAATLTGHLMSAQQEPSKLYKIGLGSVRFLLSVGDLLIGWQLLRQAEIAMAALENGATGADEAFYSGKVAVAQFFARNVLPELTATRAVLSNLDNDIMELDEAAF
ncbi:acyl-CoA dehydrogenase [Nocardia gipuzkoensis]|uniref:acyl-CoA dehydrogenase n=1 Tax=Nocardia gipuzkoensis TaxID=2749991 RepID=UPI00237EA5BD|nr:acyl-CoA dehydrogenase [Nocardia gipuzkoensis]MDE1675276.1 acyl-CoA dehydrogenase [Nocardia gipuzkoensis]